MAELHVSLRRLALWLWIAALLVTLSIPAAAQQSEKQKEQPAEAAEAKPADNDKQNDEDAADEEADEDAAGTADKDTDAGKDANVAEKPSAATAADTHAPRLLRPSRIVDTPAGEVAEPREPGQLPLDDVEIVGGKAASQTGAEDDGSNEAAGNVADGGVAPAPDGVAAPRPDAGTVAPGSPAPGESPRPRTLAEELREGQVQLPDIARDEPGFIPDTEPGDLFREPEQMEPQDFGSLLGDSELPPGDVPGIIVLGESLPGRDLPENYARVVVPNGTIEGSTETKQFHMEGGVIIYFNEVTITADEADIDEKNEVAVLKGSVNVDDPKYTLKTDVMQIFFGQKQFRASGFVQFKKLADSEKSQPNLNLPKKDRLREYFAGKEFQLFARDLYYNWESKEMSAIGEVQLIHPSFSGTMDRVDYNDDTKQYDIAGEVLLKVRDYQWIFDNRLVEPEDEKRIRALTDTDADIKADRLVYDEATGVAQFYALPGKDVVFDQRKRSITASYIEVNDTTKDFYAEGSDGKQVTYRQTDGKWLLEGELIRPDEASEDLVKALQDPLDVYADSLVYNFDRKRLELHGAVNVVGQTTSLVAGEIVQDETAKFFLMRDNVVIKPDADSEIYASQVYLDTANDVITFVGLVQGKIKSDDIAAATAELSPVPSEAAGAPAQGVFENVPQSQEQLRRGSSGANVAEGEG